MCPVIVFPEEFQNFCARFHGQMSHDWCANKGIGFTAPQPCLDSDGHPVDKLRLKAQFIARQFVHEHYDKLDSMMQNVQEPTELIKPLHKWLNAMRTELPQAQQAEVGFGWNFGLREFSWMFPHLWCIIQAELAIYKERLTEAMVESIEFEQPNLARALLLRADFQEAQCSFIMNVAMTWRKPVVEDENPYTPNLGAKLIHKDKILSHYFSFPEASRILLAFSTFSTLTGDVGKCRVQVPLLRTEFPIQGTHWFHRFKQKPKRGGVVVEILTDKILDIRIERVPAGSRVGAFIDRDLQTLDEDIARPVFKCRVAKEHQESIGGNTYVWVDAQQLAVDSGSVELLLSYAAEKALELGSDRRMELEKLLNSVLAVVGNKEKTGTSATPSKTQESEESKGDQNTGDS